LPKKSLIDSPYTLVLDLDETLIHFVNTQEESEDNNSQDGAENDFFYMVRPFCNKFLCELSKYYEIVIFTAAMQDYADWIVDGIDHRGNIKYRLYR
jgi:CTD small phosphatase-like protein 2